MSIDTDCLQVGWECTTATKLGMAVIPVSGGMTER